MLDNILAITLQKVYLLLPVKIRGSALGMMVLLLFNSILEIVGLAAILPIIMILLQDNIIEDIKVFRWLYQLFSFESQTNFLVIFAVLVMAFMIAKNVFSLLIYKQQAKFSFKLYTYFSLKLFKAYQNKDLKFFKSHNPSIIIRDINEIPYNFVYNIILNLITILNEFIIIVIILITIFLYDPLLVLFLLVFVVPILTIFYRVVKNRSKAIQQELNEENPKLNINLFQFIYGFIDAKMNNSEKYFLENHRKHLVKVSELNMLDRVFQQAPTKVIETGLMATITIVALYGLLFVRDKQHIVGLLSVFALAAYRILPSINRSMIALVGLKGFQYTFDVLNQLTHSDTTSSKAILVDISFSSHIKIKNVSFSYNSDKGVLDDVSFKIKKNSITGLIGRSGSGKSTLVNLLLGFYAPTSGEICIDDVPLEVKNITSWRRKNGYVQQDVYILDATLAENIAFGVPKEKIDADQLARAMSLASLSDVVNHLPDGVNTNLGDRGSLLSGGQRQRIGIARALYHGATLLILDEATSALDATTENEINEAVSRLADNNMTVIIIAHRLTTLRRCDSIIELESGKIKRICSYGDLINKPVE
ncbi:ABC transporter ATP-binding protein [Pontibacter qinzhouensis]|uniref:ABC transporter ATP-binding protein n=1 Tax=Pontibacter qinzhouensis TaxID=2603253 RepID=A0A5C8K9R1_9BACT|nr:ABC transporter ATP-binding protein [Pontibacter qinzhouensis]TXK46975.1 ABC transporter ATP-binding protein [Pontibacter qinzhouensis]